MERRSKHCPHPAPRRRTDPLAVVPAGLLAALLAIAVAGCGGGSDKNEEPASTDNQPWEELPVRPRPQPYVPPGAGNGSSPGAGDNSGSGAAPSPPPPVLDRSAGPGVTAFGQTVYPLLAEHCNQCHAGEGPGTPAFAHSDIPTAYSAALDNQKVSLSLPANSRLVQRLVTDFHYCWNLCTDDGAQMTAAITRWVRLAGGDSQDTGEVRITSASLTLADASEASGAGRVSQGVIALWDFREGSGDVARDSSGVTPAMDLTLTGSRWIIDGGIEINEGKAIAEPQTSRKLYDRIAAEATGSQAYSVEAWVVPASTNQEGPARIVSYSGDTTNRNFDMAQVLYSYIFRNRSDNMNINANGNPALRTRVADPMLQTTLQHVVMTFDQQNARRIYINGNDTGVTDKFGSGLLGNWDAGYTLVMGNETTGNRPWNGQIRLAVVYDRALLPAEVKQNFQAGVGEKFLLDFDISEALNIPGSLVRMEVRQLDDFSYVFSNPVFVIPAPSAIPVSGIHIAVNDRIPVAGQTFTTIDTTVTNTQTPLSRLGAVIAKDKGPEEDRFALVFDALGDRRNVVAQPPPAAPIRSQAAQAAPRLGVRTFDQINDTMAVVTGVDPATPAIARAFADLKQQLPSAPDLGGFLSAHQVGIAKLALEYCDALVESTALRNQFFGGDPSVGFDQPVSTALSGAANRSRVVDPLVERVIGVDLSSQPSAAAVAAELNGLLDELTAACGTGDACGPKRTRSVVKAACTAVLASASVLIQ